MKLGLNRHFNDIEVFQIAHDRWPCHITYAHQLHGFIHMNEDGERYSIPFNVAQFIRKLLLCKINGLLSSGSFINKRTKTCIW
jgi:hypothetical protein